MADLKQFTWEQLVNLTVKVNELATILKMSTESNQLLRAVVVSGGGAAEAVEEKQNSQWSRSWCF
jgi:large subunit ribosomal protein L7/L12